MGTGVCEDWSTRMTDEPELDVGLVGREGS